MLPAAETQAGPAAAACWIGSEDVRPVDARRKRDVLVVDRVAPLHADLFSKRRAEL